MSSSLARPAHDATEALHSLVYFCPEAEERLVGLGLRPGRMPYFASRSAPMGAVGAGVVAATFYNFNPAVVGRAIPEAWSIATPAAIIEARFAAVDAALSRLLGPEVIASDDMARIATLTRAATEGCRVEGRPLCAAHLDLQWPDTPHVLLWHALTILREHRGDGHIAALTAAGISGIDALITHDATGRGFAPGFGQVSRGWKPEAWAAATEGLVARGLLDDAGALTPAGKQLRAHVESETDRMAAPPWEHLGEERTQEVIRIGKALSRVAGQAGAFPAGVFALR